MPAVVVLTLDKENRQDDFQYMAKDIANGEYVVGYIVIDKPWYSNPKDWTYYIFNNEYDYEHGFCGGATDLGLKKTKIDPNTIEPYTQTANIKLNQIRGLHTRIITPQHNFITVITPKDKIPYELWE